jgi:hypothetical protein
VIQELSRERSQVISRPGRCLPGSGDSLGGSGVFVLYLYGHGMEYVLHIMDENKYDLGVSDKCCGFVKAATYVHSSILPYRWGGEQPK